MNNSYSKKRHIQNANMLLERRYLRENDPEPDTTDNSTIIDMWVKKLPDAKKWWKDWLGHEITKGKFIKLNNLDITTADDYYKKYFDILDKIELKFYDHVNLLNYDSPNFTPNYFEPSDPMRIFLIEQPGIRAFVRKDMPSIVGVNLSNSKNRDESTILTTLIHEIQHSLYFIFPLTPDQKVGEFASSGDGCFDKNYEKYNDTKLNLIDKIKTLAGENIKNIATDLGITEEDVSKFIELYLKVAYGGFYGRNYLFSKNEILSFLTGIRGYFGITPDKNLTKDQLKDYILNFENQKHNFQVLYMLAHWAMKGFPPLEDFVNELNSFAKTDPTKQKPSPLDSPYQPKDYYS